MKISTFSAVVSLVVLGIASNACGQKWVNYTIDDQLGDEVTGRLVRVQLSCEPGYFSFSCSLFFSFTAVGRLTFLCNLQVTYSPPGQYWSQGNNCTQCAFHPDNKSAFDGMLFSMLWTSVVLTSVSLGTWHDGFRVPDHDPEPLTFTFKFNGPPDFSYS